MKDAELAKALAPGPPWLSNLKTITKWPHKRQRKSLQGEEGENLEEARGEMTNWDHLKMTIAPPSALRFLLIAY